MRFILFGEFSFGKMWKFLEKRPFFRADMARLGKYSMGGYGRIGVYRVKAHIPLRTAFALGTQRDKKWDKQHEIYMVNVTTLRWGSNATYIIPLTRIGVKDYRTEFALG